ncbi:unnamed protein product [Vicia faba]|uniref:Uncharacterized protein n=1 Tax=Vicia faba TaxID=3906 RepID=A0AAV1A8J0_VICFA|nr:unnamed protein product [Vicia faba]
MESLNPVNNNTFGFPYATKYCVRGMDYGKNPRFNDALYRNLLDHLGPDDFVWRPYLEVPEHGGKERTENEFQHLCVSSGFSIFHTASTDISAMSGVMEFYK